MLGKGLESLIPPKANNSQNNDDHGQWGGIADHDIEPSRELPDGVGDGAADLRPSDELPAGPAAPKILVGGGPSVLPSVQPSSAGSSQQPKPEPADSEPQSSRAMSQPQKTYVSRPATINDQGGSEARQRRHDGQGDVIQESVFQIEVEKIEPNPGQPRRVFDQGALRDMAHSIREFGILQPLVVTKIEKETPMGIDVFYQLIAGERRLMAAKLLGLRVVPAIVRKVGLEREKLELAIIENIQRENLNPLETARAFQRLQEEFRMTQREIAAKMGKSREVVANTVRLLDLPIYVQDALGNGELSESHARMLLAIEDPGAQKRLFDEILTNGLTTRDVKERVKQMTKPRPYHHRLTGGNLAPEVKALQETLSISLGAPVEIQKSPTNDGKITITFYSDEELESILKRLGNKEE